MRKLFTSYLLPFLINTTLLRLLRAMDLSGRMGLKATGSVTEQEALLDREPVIGTILRTKAH
jgi:hypothetical protein